MQFVLYAVAGLFVALSFFMLFAFYRTQHIGLLFMSAAYGVSGMVAGYYLWWWPLLLGFAVVWIIRFLGLDPDAPRAGKSADQDASGPPPGAGQG